ncbi:MAG: hypothetical protein HY537_15655 [Deltaproteobacteria bacterium]|nr:hypothetical protein [Deltaproteobacteria bacterium]
MILLLIVLRTTAEPILPTAFWQWDLLLPFVVYFGQRRPVIEGLLLSLFASHLYSICSSAPIGVFAVYYVGLFFLARVLSYVIYANRIHTILLLMWVLSLFGKAWLCGIAVCFGHGWPLVGQGWGLLGSVTLNAFIGSILYWWVGMIDRMTFKAPQANIQLSENEI